MPLLQKAVRIFEVHDDFRLPSAVSELSTADLQEGKYALLRSISAGRWTSITGCLRGIISPSLCCKAVSPEAYLGERHYNQAALIQQAITANRTSAGDSHFGLARLLVVEATIEAKQSRASDADAHYRQAWDIYKNP